MYGSKKYKNLWLGFLLLTVFFLANLVNSPASSAQLSTRQTLVQNLPNQTIITAATAKIGRQTPSQLPQAQSGETIHLPIIFHSPQASSLANCNPTNGSGGLAPGAYDTTIAGVKAIVVVGKGYNRQKSTLLGFNLHGDGGDYSSIKKPTNDLNEAANKHGWILVSPLAPNGSSWWRDWQGDHNQKLVDVFKAMFAKYNVCRDFVMGTTGSGGSEYWTAYFFPAKGGQYPAHVLVACGGNDGTARNQVLALGKNSSVVAKSSFHFVYGTKDRLVPLIEDSIDLYKRAGFKVTVQKLQGAGHCNKWKDEGLPVWHERAADYWEKLAQKLN